MSRPIGRQGDHDGFGGHRTPRGMRRLLPALLVLLLVPVISVLKVPPATTGTVPCDCQTCHTDPHGGGFGCGTCHGVPPATGSHRVHFDNNAPLDSPRYGDATNRSTADAYVFDCGNCHPLDSAKHFNGTVEVELYNASAPAETLKAKNPSSAAYDNVVTRTCSNVYCHSGYTVASGNVGPPLTYPGNPVPPGYTLNTPSRPGTQYIMDPTCSNLTYAPYTVTIARDYRTTPAWGSGGAFTTCTECHAFPLTTYYPAVSAMAGDTHQWVDENGWNWGHAYNMIGYGGIPCATCHYRSVDHSGGGSYPHAQTTNPPTYWAGNIIAYNPAPIKNRSIHVNGRPDVAFDNVNGYRYYGPPYYDDQFDLNTATYDAPTKTCSNVSCHYNSPVVSTWQRSPKWGSPYGPYSVSGASQQCDLCHRMGYLSPTCTPAP